MLCTTKLHARLALRFIQANIVTYNISLSRNQVQSFYGVLNVRHGGQVIVIFSNRQDTYFSYSATLFCPHVGINIRKFVTVGSPCAAKFHAISFMWLVCFANMVVKFLSKVSPFVSPFHSPKTGQGTWVYFPMSGNLISFCISLYLELYFHVVNLASFDKHLYQVISVNFAFILVSLLPFVVSQAYHP